MIGPLNELTRNKIVFLKELGDSYQLVGRKYFNTQEQVRYRKHTFKVPRFPSMLNKWGKSTYYIDFDTGKHITFKFDKKNIPFSADELDKFLCRGFIGGLINSLKTQMQKDWALMIMALGCGVGIGFIVCFALVRGF